MVCNPVSSYLRTVGLLRAGRSWVTGLCSLAPSVLALVSSCLSWSGRALLDRISEGRSHKQTPALNADARTHTHTHTHTHTPFILSSLSWFLWAQRSLISAGVWAGPGSQPSVHWDAANSIFRSLYPCPPPTPLPHSVSGAWQR